MDLSSYAVLTREQAAEKAAGNWQKFDSFAWSYRAQPDDADLYTIIHPSNRDSGLLEQSNSDAMAKELKEFEDSGEVDWQSFSHWGCGWVDALIVKVYTDHSKACLTPAFERLCDLLDALCDYPVLDDEDFSRREYEATLENIDSAGSRFLVEDPPEDWVNQAFDWFWTYDQQAIECCDGGGGYPSDAEIKTCLADLQLLDPEYR